MSDDDRREEMKILYNAMGELVRQEFLDYFLYDLKTLIIFRNLPMFRDLVSRVLDGALDEKLEGKPNK